MDPEKRTVEMFALRGHVYEPLGIFRVGETARSALLQGFEIPVEEIFAAQGR